MRYQFDWDPAKEKQNIRKHQLNFRQALTLFLDPSQLSLYDDAHSQEEDRWITIGLDNTCRLRVVIHTFDQIDSEYCLIRIISARKATFLEQSQYQGKKIMKSEYDFSKAEQGKFYNQNSQFHYPIYLEDDVNNFLEKVAQDKNIDLQKLVNELLRNNIKIIQSIQ